MELRAVRDSRGRAVGLAQCRQAGRQRQCRMARPFRGQTGAAAPRIPPAGGTFLCFTDYARPSMRIAALSHTAVVYIMTHDSIGLGEDGPTHQPVEHLAALRAMPNMQVFRPADAVETAECWQLALEKI